MTRAGNTLATRADTPQEDDSFLCLNQERVKLSRELSKLNGQAPPFPMMCVCLLITGPVDIQALKNALHRVVQRHGALRTVFRPSSAVTPERQQALNQFARTGITPRGLYLQREVEEADVEFRVHDIRSLDASARTASVRRILQVETVRPLDEQKVIGLRANLIHEENLRHVLIVSLDHIVSDGWSMNIIQRETEQLYRHFSEGAPPPSALRISYQEYSRRQNELLQSSSWDSHLDYWEVHWREFGASRLAVGDLPFARAASSQETDSSYQSERLTIEPAQVESLRAAARRHHVTLFVLFLASFLTALRHYTGRTKLALWSHCSNRNTENADLIGFFIQTHLTGFDITDDLTVSELLTRVAMRRLETAKHECMPLQHLWRTLGFSPRFGDSGIMMDYQTEEVDTPTPTAATFSRTTIDVPAPRRVASLGVYVTDRANTISLRSDYAPAWYPADAIRDLLQDIQRIVLAFAKDPDARVGDFMTVAARYASRSRPYCSEMDEFIVLGSGSIPKRRKE